VRQRGTIEAGKKKMTLETNKPYPLFLAALSLRILGLKKTKNYFHRKGRLSHVKLRILKGFEKRKKNRREGREPSVKNRTTCKGRKGIPYSNYRKGTVGKLTLRICGGIARNKSERQGTYLWRGPVPL